MHLGSGHPTFHRVVDWLTSEAELLDERRFDEWLDLMSPQIRYSMPIRLTVSAADGDGVDDDYAHFDEDYVSLRTRIRRLAENKSNFAEDPPSRTRHFVSNVRVFDDGNRLTARSYLLATRSRGDSPNLDLIACERLDQFEQLNDELRLVERKIIIDQSNIGTVNLAIFL